MLRFGGTDVADLESVVSEISRIALVAGSVIGPARYDRARSILGQTTGHSPAAYVVDTDWYRQLTSARQIASYRLEESSHFLRKQRCKPVEDDQFFVEIGDWRETVSHGRKRFSQVVNLRDVLSGRTY